MMKKTGAVLGICAGIAGMICAIFEVFYGGLGSGMELAGAGRIFWMGVAGFILSAIVTGIGRMALEHPRRGGWELIVLSIITGIVGGPFVAVCMVLGLIGGILCYVHDRRPAGEVATPGHVTITRETSSTTTPTTKR